MPELPPLVGHLKADPGNWDAEMAMVMASAGGAADAMELLNEAYDGARNAALEDAEANHMLRDASLESATATELLSRLLDTARDHAMEDAAANAWLARSMKEVRDAAATSTVAVRANSAAKTANAAASTEAAAAGFPFMGVLVGIGVAAGIGLAPIAALSVGFLGAATVLGLFAGGAVAFGAIAILVANATGQVNRQMAALERTAQAAATTVGRELAPIARQFLGLLQQLIPIAVSVTRPMVQAFNEVLPAVLPLVKILSVDLLGTLSTLGVVAADFLGQVGARTGEFQSLFELLQSQGIQAVIGLLTNLLRLSDWFFRVLPSLGGPTGGFFSALGSLVQWVASVVAGFAEWVGANWPAISGFFIASGRAIADGFAFVAPVIGFALAVLQKLGPVVQFIHDHANELKPILYAIGALAAIMAASFLLTVGSVLLIVGAFVGLFLIGDKVVNWLKVEVPAGIRAAGAAFSALGSAVHGFLNAAGPAIGRFFSGLGTQVQAGIRAVGGAFSALGTMVHGALMRVLATAEAVWREFSSRPAYWIGAAVGFVVVGLYRLQAAVTDWAGNMVIRALKWAFDMIQAAQAMAVGFVAAVIVKVYELQGRFTDWVIGMAATAVKWAHDMIDTAEDLAVKFVIALAREWQALPGQIWGWLSSVVPRVIAWAGGMLQLANQTANSFVRAFNDELGRLPGQVWDIGRNIVLGLWNGFQSLTGWLVRQINSFVGGLVDGAKAALGIHSPSLVFAAEVGLPIAQGVAQGITRGAAGARAAMGGLFEGALAAGSGGQGAIMAGPGSGAGGPATIELHTHVYLGNEEIAHLVDRRSNARLSRLLTAT